uniref:Glycine rich superfamily member n=1 Tax=Rhipicephalus zambeziensis TaxID=60191 RepID=A0A224Y6B9_9ACAR
MGRFMGPTMGRIMGWKLGRTLGWILGRFPPGLEQRLEQWLEQRLEQRLAAAAAGLAVNSRSRKRPCTVMNYGAINQPFNSQKIMKHSLASSKQA